MFAIQIVVNNVELGNSIDRFIFYNGMLDANYKILLRYRFRFIFIIPKCTIFNRTLITYLTYLYEGMLKNLFMEIQDIWISNLIKKNVIFIMTLRSIINKLPNMNAYLFSLLFKFTGIKLLITSEIS